MYIDGGVIRESVDRLGKCGSTLYADFLICKRTLVLASTDDHQETEITTGTLSVPFKQAHLDVAGIPQHDGTGSPFFVPFGHDRDSTVGFRSVKYPSNGVSDNINRWASRQYAPVKWVEGTADPKKFVLVSQPKEHMAKFFKVDGQRADTRPFLFDAAIWWLRDSNIDDLLDENGDLVADRVTERFVAECGLTADDVDVLFKSGIPPQAQNGETPA